MKIESLDLSEARAAMLKSRRVNAAVHEAAKMDRLTYDWAFKILSVNQEVGMDQDRLVARSRELANDDTTMTKFLAAVWKNVFGPDGIKMQSKVMLQRGKKPNQTANYIIDLAWKEWCKKENCSYDKRTSWVQMQRTVSRTVAIDGECFIRKIIDSTNPFGFCLEIVNADRVDRTIGRNVPVYLPNGNRLFMGIEMNPVSGAVVAYHIFDRHPSEFGQGPRQRVRVPADQIIHIFLPVRDNQYRGLPWATPAMFRLNMLKGYIEAEVVAARVAACQMGFITRNLDPDAQYTGEVPENDMNGGRDIPMEAGAFGQLAPGESIQQFKPEHPTTAFESFVKGAKLDIAAGLDLSYMSLSGDVAAANYSSARVGLLDERDTWEGLQGFFIEELCQPVFSAWLRLAFLRLQLPGVQWAAYDCAEWHPRSFPWVDPLKDTQATLLQLQNGFTTLHKVLAARGEDYDEVMDELQQEQEDIKARGIKIGTDSKGVADTATDDQNATDTGGNPTAKPGAAWNSPRFVMLNHKY